MEEEGLGWGSCWSGGKNLADSEGSGEVGGHVQDVLRGDFGGQHLSTESALKKL